MVYRLFLLIFISISSICHSSIIYEKNEIIITNIDLKNYLNIYENNNGIRIPKNQAIKNIFLMRQTINFLLNNNPEFMKILDQNIRMEFGDVILKEKNLFEYIRFQKIRNEFISEYFLNNFSNTELEMIFIGLSDLKIPISENKCLTINKLHSFNDNNKKFIKNLYDALKNRRKEFETTIDNRLYYVCLNDKLFKRIESEIIKYIENKTENTFNEFIYSKLN